MNKWIKEILWLTGIVVLPMFLLFDFSGGEPQTLDLNIHDTYYVIENNMFAFMTVASLVFIVYLVRLIIGRFRNVIANIVFMIANAVFLILFTYKAEYLIIVQVALLFLLAFTAFKTGQKFKKIA